MDLRPNGLERHLYHSNETHTLRCDTRRWVLNVIDIHDSLHDITVCIMISVQEVELGLVDLVCRMRESSLQPGEDTCYKRIEPQMCRVQKYQCIIRP